MRRILLMVLRNLLIVPGGWIKLCYRASHVDKYTEEDNYEFLRWIVFRANKGGNVTIDVHGQENIPKQQGLYDVLAIVEACTHPFSVVAKKEVENVPFLKQVFKIMKAFMIDREDVRQAMKTITSVTKEVVSGRNYLIFPEGTRSKNGNNVGSFKGGSFKAATKAKCPSIPVALVDSFKPFDTNSTRPVTVQVHFLKPMLYEDYKDMKTVEIAAAVEQQIQETINKNLTKEKVEEKC